jgi:hypothetical protein
MIVRTGEVPSEAALAGARSVLFGVIDGMGADDQRAWKRFWKGLFRLEPGEMAQVELVFPRNSRFHRKFFALLNLGFDAWEPPRQRKTYKGLPVVKNFECFREEVIIAAGFYEQTFGLNGRLKLTAKSISFAQMDDLEFERVYSAVANVLLAGVLLRYAGRDELDGVIDRLLGFV